MGYFEDYVLATSENELPTSYHKWAAVSLIASAVGRKVWVNQGIFTVYPNWYTIFVTDPGEGKSIAKNLAAKMLEGVPNIPITHEAMSKQELTSVMGAEDSPCKKFFELDGEKLTYTQLTIFCDELVDFLKVADPMQLIIALTAMYDGKYGGVATKNQGRDVIKNPYINILACVTKDSLTGLVKETIIDSGFSRRCIWVYDPQKTKAVPLPEITKEMKDAWDRCVSRLNKIASLKGQFGWEQDAKDYYTEWYEKNHEEKYNSELAAEKFFKSSKRTMVIRLAMLLRMAKVNELVLTKDCIEDAVKWLDLAESYIPGLLGSAGTNENATVAQAILDFLANKGPVKKKKILAQFYKDSKDIEKVIEHLYSSGQIVVFGKTEGEGKRQVQVDYVRLPS